MASEYVPYDKPVVTRQEALTAQQKKYFTGKPCPHGHIAERWVSTRACLVCAGYQNRREAEAVYRAKHRAEARLKTAAWRSNNSDRAKLSKASYQLRAGEMIKARRRERYAANAEKLRAEKRARYAADSTSMLEANRRYAAGNPEVIQAVRRNRKARKKDAAGSHTAEDIKQIWRLQKGKCASNWCRADLHRSSHVDHIVALSPCREAGLTIDVICNCYALLVI